MQAPSTSSLSLSFTDMFLFLFLGKSKAKITLIIAPIMRRTGRVSTFCMGDLQSEYLSAHWFPFPSRGPGSGVLRALYPLTCIVLVRFSQAVSDG